MPHPDVENSVGVSITLPLHCSDQVLSKVVGSAEEDSVECLRMARKRLGPLHVTGVSIALCASAGRFLRGGTKDLQIFTLE